MFKLTVTQLATNKTLVLKTSNFPTREEIIQLCGVAPTDLVLQELKVKKHFSGIHNHYELHEFKVPTVTELQQAWSDWTKSAMYQGQRFGQYVYNIYGYEIGNSYEIQNADKAYQHLFDSITTSLDYLLGANN